ncbi:hypothetical protein M885DRAFT_519491 [Pelagophyceae sp. CCMP2097]|nr:hypothetical protein M885DRAFT_519491 [Pelagophyceae sp. CCMP2097]
MSRFKTTLCEHFQKGYCSFEGRCSFAHGAHELREEIEIDMTGATPPPETQRAAPAPARPPARAGPTPAQAAAAAKVPRPPPAAVRAPTDDELDRAVQLSLRDHATSTADDAALRAILAESKKMSLAPRPPRDDGKWQAEMEALVAPSATPGKWTPDAEYPTLGAHSATPSTWTPDAEYPTRGAHVEPIRASTPADNGKRSIEDLLTELGLLEYMSCLKSQLVFNVRDLSYCDDADLEMCGIHSMYARARILDAAG